MEMKTSPPPYITMVITRSLKLEKTSISIVDIFETVATDKRVGHAAEQVANLPGNVRRKKTRKKKERKELVESCRGDLDWQVGAGYFGRRSDQVV
ncbi:hypothetical protein CRG98_023213 [Punica granatum]|uniref:Uncharacterized protein n=1 Tax=Punica granatum TaxID=22663 RepID=A0A2I0JKE2_PUNGR|nr:hypothetical protein CRG98_023213 [Punica granatum]